MADKVRFQVADMRKIASILSGEKPFDGRCEGLAWDGKHLWALDNTGKRICVIEKAEHGAD